MHTFNKIYNSILNEFNIEDRNDPSFYDYVVIFLQQLKQLNLLAPEKVSDLRKTALQIVKNGYYNFIDENNNISQKIQFLFDSSKDVNSMRVVIKDLLNPGTEDKVIDNTHEETSVNEITDFLQLKKDEALKAKNAGKTAPAAVGGSTPSAMPGAVTPVNTSEYLKGL